MPLKLLWRKRSRPLVRRGRRLSFREILHAAEDQPEVHLTTSEDILPGGYAAAMLPVRIDWAASSPEGQDGYYVLRDVNAGSNPYGQRTVLRSVRIPARRLESAEYVVVPLDRFGRRGLIAHGMLRFVFEADAPGVLLALDGRPAGPAARVPDLILSWEAWRPPGVAFDVRRGMDPANFRLTLRAYTGHQRFLEDALGGRGWYAYPLRLPGGRDGAAELLHTSLRIGDHGGREVLAELLATADEEWLAYSNGDHDPVQVRREWEELRDRLRDSRRPEDTRLTCEGEGTRYQTLFRSCATMAFHAINATVERQLERGVPAEGMRPAGSTTPHSVPEWMRHMATEPLGRILLRLPFLVGVLLRHPYLVPTAIPGRLAAAGLLERENGRPVMYHYDARTETPYGRLGDALIE